MLSLAPSAVRTWMSRLFERLRERHGPPCLLTEMEEGGVFGESPVISVIELYVTPFDDWEGWDRPDKIKVSRLSAGKVVGFGIIVYDHDPFEEWRTAWTPGRSVDIRWTGFLTRRSPAGSRFAGSRRQRGGVGLLGADQGRTGGEVTWSVFTNQPPCWDYAAAFGSNLPQPMTAREACSSHPGKGVPSSVYRS